VSDVVFPGSRQGVRAVQAVEVVAARGGGAAGAAARRQAGGGEGREHAYRFTWCLEKVESGSMKGCWLTVGVRVGDYSA